MVWHVRTDARTSCAQYDEYCGPFSKHLAKYYAGERAHAWEAMRQFEVNRLISDEADAYWAKHAPGGTVKAVLSVHVRGTDKDPVIGGYKVTPEKYYPFIDTFLAEHAHMGAKVFIATDSPMYLREIEKKYGDKVGGRPPARPPARPLAWLAGWWCWLRVRSGPATSIRDATSYVCICTLRACPSIRIRSHAHHIS
jgi:hypothetical protein